MTVRDGHWAGLEYHHQLLDDVVRIDAYDRAIRALVRPGDTVLDLGGGTGVLAMLAARRGAFVHLIESTPIARVARQLIASNGLADRIVVHEANARTLAPAAAVDLVFSDFMGRLVVDDGMLPALDAARAWMKPTARFCPHRVDLHLAPVAVRLRPVEVFATSMLGLDLRPALPLVLDAGWGARLHHHNLLADPALFASFHPAEGAPTLANEVSFVLRAGRLQAIAGWFAAELAPDVVLATGPGGDTHWGQYLFAVPAIDVRDGDVVTFDLRWHPGDDQWRWRGTIARAGAQIASFHGTSDPGMADRTLTVVPVAPRGRDVALAAHHLAVTAFGEGRIRDAAEAWETAVAALEPGDDDLAPALWENVGIARMNLGEDGAAARAFLRAIDGRPASREQSARWLPAVLERAGLAGEGARWRALYVRYFA